MAKSKKGLRIGNYRITPLGLGVLAVLLLIIIAVVVLVVVQPFGGEDGISLFSRATPTPTPTVTPTPTPTPTPSPTPEPTPRAATIRSLGEIAIQDNLLAAGKTADGSYDFSPMFSDIAGVIGNADYTVADVEGALGDTQDPSGGTLMRTPSSLIAALKDCGVDMLNLANDHALDGYYDDLLSTMSKCRDVGMDYVGAASSLVEHDTAKIITINDIRVGFLAYTESVNGMEKKSDSEAVEYGINLITKKTKPKSDVDTLRGAGADVIVAYCSWGEMFSREATKSQTQIAQTLADLGVDVIIGYNPHVIQPATWIESTDKDGNVTHRTLCLGAPGNFLSDATEDNSNTGIIFQFTIQQKDNFSGYEITDPCYVPTCVLRSEKEGGGYDYRTLAIGQWLETAPEGMSYADHSKLKELWATVQGYMGADVATVIAE